MNRRVYHFQAQDFVYYNTTITGYLVPFTFAKVVHFAMRNESDEWPTLWAEVIDDREGVVVDGDPGVYIVVGTGHPIGDGWEHEGTALTGGMLVWHLYSICRPMEPPR